MNDYLTGEDYNRLSLASRDLVKQVGGLDRARDITGYKQRAQITRCTTIEGQERRFFPISAIAEMESDAAESGFVPPVTKALAAISGFDLIRRQACKGDQCALTSLADLMKAFADASSSVADAYADGKLTPEEKAVCVDRLETLLDQGARTLAILNGQKVTAEG